jgi:anthranilate synthase component 1
MFQTRLLPDSTDLLALQRLAPQRYPLLMESTASGTAQGRWDLLLMGNGESLALHADGVVRDHAGGAHDGSFLDALDAHWQALRLPREETGLPFRGGWALMLDYELAGQIETVLALPARADGLPSALALRCPAAVLHDRVLGQFHAVCETDHAALRDTLLEDLQATATLPPLPQWQPPAQMDEDAPTRFTDGVGKVIDYLRAGDVFQVNLSRRWSARFDEELSPQALYAQLRVANPAPFAGLFIAQGRAVVSSSPERLVSVHGDDVQTRPIAGTRPRSPAMTTPSASANWSATPRSAPST